MLKVRRLVVAVVVMFVFGLPAAGRGAVLLDDNFDSENGGVGQDDYTGFANWNVVSGSVDLVGNGSDDFLPGNGLYVDMDGSMGAGGTLESKQTFTLQPGPYLLQFRLAGAQRPDPNVNTVTVTLGTVFSESFTLANSDPFALISRTIFVTSATSAKLSFAQNGGDNQGLLLDNVTLATGSTGAPALSSGTTLGLCGLLVAVGLRLLRRTSRRSSQSA